MKATLNAWTTLFLLAALFGLASSLFFMVRKKGRGSSNRLLGLFLLLYSLTLIDSVGYWTGYQQVWPHLLNLSSTFPFLFGPVLFLYVTSVADPGRVFRIRNLVHFLPFLVFAGFMLPFYLQPEAAKLEFMERELVARGISARSAGVISMKSLHLLSYSVVILFYAKFRLFRKKIRTSNFSSDHGRWLNVVGYNFLGFSFCFALYYLLAAIPDFEIKFDYLISLVMTAFIFTNGYLGYRHTDILDSGGGNNNNYEDSSLSPRVAKRYEYNLLTYMDLEKPHRDGVLRLADLARELSIPPIHLSKVLSDRLGTDFKEFITDYRIREAREILSDPSKRDYKVLRVAFESGFSNKRSFIRAFKKYMGMTPSEYRSRALAGR